MDKVWFIAENAPDDNGDDDRPVDGFDAEAECQGCYDCTCRTPCDYLMAVVEDEGEAE